MMNTNLKIYLFCAAIIFAAWLIPPPAARAAAFALVDSRQATSSSATSVNKSFATNPSAGNLVVVAVSAYNQRPASVTDNQGNSYILASSVIVKSGASTPVYLNLYYAKSVASSGTFTITASTNGPANKLSMVIAAYSGADTSAPLDFVGADTSVSSTATTFTSQNVSSTTDGELYFGAMTDNGTEVVSTSSPWIELQSQNNSSSQSLYTVQRIENIATSTAAKWTVGTADQYAAIIATFKPAAPYRPVTFVQSVASTTLSAGQIVSSTSMTFPNNNVAGDLIVAWFEEDDTVPIVSISDSKGNTYAQAGAEVNSGSWKSVVYYAQNIAAGANTLTLTLNATTSAAFSFYALEYMGVSTSTAFDTSTGAFGTNGTPSSGNFTTAYHADLITGFISLVDANASPGAGFREVTYINGNLSEDRMTTLSGVYQAKMASCTCTWIVMGAAFKQSL